MSFPGVVLVAVGSWIAWELRDSGDAMGIGIGIGAAGVALIAFAYFHYKHLMAERPSDVVLDVNGLRIEGGRRAGLAFDWADIDAPRSRLLSKEEKRVTGVRLVLNLPLIAVSMFGGDDATVGLTQQVAVHQLFVVRKRGGESVLLAETDVDLERSSLETLLHTMQSSRWQPAVEATAAPAPTPEPTKKKKKGKASRAPTSAAEHPMTITCDNCGAIVAPSGSETVKCSFCNGDVAIRADVRKRVEAATSLASARSSGMSRLERLLASQPSARLATTTMWLAALPIAIAWPLAGWLAVRNFELGLVTPGRVAALMLLPLLLTFAAFALARARLTDRFALHAVVIGFGARDPARPGEPYRCRSCTAALPAATSSPIVHCIYCNKPNVLGLDLSGDAAEARAESKQLDVAFDAREKERTVWRIAAVAAVVAIASSVLVVRSTFADIKRISFRPRDFTATVASTTNLPKSPDSTMPPLEHVTWTGRIAPAEGPGVNCHLSLHATAEHENPFTYEHDGRCTFAASGEPLRYSDAWTSRGNGVEVDADFEKTNVVLHEKYVDNDYVGTWKITLHAHSLQSTP
jgi:hypothetical protein